MAYCPNCGDDLQSEAMTCTTCGAQFGPNAAWRPLSVPPPHRDLDELQRLRLLKEGTEAPPPPRAPITPRGRFMLGLLLLAAAVGLLILEIMSAAANVFPAIVMYPVVGPAALGGGSVVPLLLVIGLFCAGVYQVVYGVIRGLFQSSGRKAPVRESTEAERSRRHSSDDA
jgi:hypothetical protein